MSVNKRKVGIYSFQFIHPTPKKIKVKGKDVVKPDILKGEKLTNHFKNLLTLIDAKDFKGKMKEISESKKFYYMADFSIIVKHPTFWTSVFH